MIGVSGSKLANVLLAVRDCLDDDRFVDTRHALERQYEREITRVEIVFVLRNGFHEKRRDRWDDRHRAWNYAIRGKTIDRRDIRVIVSLNEVGMLIITAIEIEEKGHGNQGAKRVR